MLILETLTVDISLTYSLIKLTILVKQMNLPAKPRASRDEILSLVARTVSENEILTERPVSDWQDCPVKIFGVRGFFAPNKNKRGIYDDAIFVETVDGDRAAFNGNVDPSRSYKQGLASLESNQIVWYRPGKHGLSRKDGGYPAFRQASVCVVRRDGGSGNGKALGNGLFQDSPSKRFWINLHKGGYNTTSSAGCQTVPPQQWDAFHALVHLYLKRYDLKQFPYLLLTPLV